VGREIRRLETGLTLGSQCSDDVSVSCHLSAEEERLLLKGGRS